MFSCQFCSHLFTHTSFRRDFNAFVRAAEKHGRKNVAQIATEVEGKTETEVRQYSEEFWRRYKELGDWEKVIKNIERGEQKLQRFNDNQTAVAGKLAKYKNPWVEVKVWKWNGFERVQ